MLEGTGKPFLTIAHANGTASDNATMALAKRGVRASIVSLSPSVHGKGDKGILFRDIANVIGRHLNLPIVSISRGEAEAHFGFLGPLAALDIPRSSVQTQELLNWQPVHPSLISDYRAGPLL